MKIRILPEAERDLEIGGDFYESQSSGLGKYFSDRLLGAGGKSMQNAVRIRTLVAPSSPLANFDPGAYLSAMEFYETDNPITDNDRDGLAQFAHLLAFMALQSQSSRWQGSIVAPNSLAYRALESHFGQLDGWPGSPNTGVPYRQLAVFLMRHFPPRSP